MTINAVIPVGNTEHIFHNINLLLIIATFCKQWSNYIWLADCFLLTSRQYYTTAL